MLEKPVRFVLDELKIPFFFEKCKFDLTPNNYGVVSHTPDYVTNVFINDARWVIECKGAPVLDNHPEHIMRMVLFMQRYGHDYHYTLVTDMQRERLRFLLEGLGATERSIAHEIIYVDYRTVRSARDENPGDSLRIAMRRLIKEKLRDLHLYSKVFREDTLSAFP